MTPQDYEYLQKLLKARSGLVLSSEKHYLLESRLLPVARRNGLFNFTGLISKLRGPAAEPLIVEVVEAMATNESFFFRDKLPFEFFRDPSCRRCCRRAPRSGASASGARPPPAARSLVRSPSH